MTLDELLLEWSYRSEKGYPSLDSPSDVSVLKKILEKLELPSNEIINNLIEASLNPSELRKDRIGKIQKYIKENEKTQVDTDWWGQDLRWSKVRGEREWEK